MEKKPKEEQLKAESLRRGIGIESEVRSTVIGSSPASGASNKHNTAW